MRAGRFILRSLSFLLFALALHSCSTKNQSAEQNTIQEKYDAHSSIIMDTTLQKLVAENIRLFSIYDTLSPSHPDYNLTPFHIPANELITLTGNKLLKKPTTDAYTIIDYYNRKIYANLKKILSHKAIHQYDLVELFRGKGPTITVSPDKKLYSISYDENTGGTAHVIVSIIHYRIGGNAVYNSFDGETLDANDGENILNQPEAYNIIDTINTKQGVKYILQGTQVSCSTCVDEYIALWRFDKHGFVCDFGYYLAGRESSESKIKYNVKRKIIMVNYTTDDLTGIDCSCNDDSESLVTDTVANMDKPVYGKKCSCVFKFDGITFH